MVWIFLLAVMGLLEMFYVVAARMKGRFLRSNGNQ
jgi:hypothetical protein